MNADELWDTTMDPSQRKLFQVRMSDVAEAVRSFSILMGSQVEPRPHFIERRALEVTDLAV